MLYAPSRVAYLTMLLHVFYIVASALFAVRCSIDVLRLCSMSLKLPARGRKKTSSKSLGQLKISNGQLQVRKKTMSVAKKTISMALRKPCPWPETGTSEGGLHKKLLKCSNFVNTSTTKRVHMTRATGRWPLGRQGRTCMFQKNLRRLAPARRLKSSGKRRPFIHLPLFGKNHKNRWSFWVLLAPLSASLLIFSAFAVASRSSPAFFTS